MFLIRFLFLLLHEVINFLKACCVDILGEIKLVCLTLWKCGQVHPTLFLVSKGIILVPWDQIDPFHQTLDNKVMVEDVLLPWFTQRPLNTSLFKVPLASSSLHSSLI